MHLKDYNKLILEHSNKFLSDNTLGIVIKTAEEIGTNVYGVFVPRIMMGIAVKDGAFEKEVSFKKSKCLNTANKKIGEDAAMASNYLELTMDVVYNLSMPRLILGEQVTIGLIDQDINSMYIKPYCRDHIKQRPTDSMAMYVPASGKYDGEDLTDENSYFIRFDSENKNIQIHMSKANGEKFKYDIFIDGSKGSLTMSDGIRTIAMNSSDDEIVMNTEAKTVVALRKNAVDISCDKFFLKANDSIEIESPKTTLKLDDVKMETKKFDGKIDNITSKGKKMALDYTKFEMKNKTCDIVSPKTSVDGLLTVTGFVCAGGIGFGAPPGQNPLPVTPAVDKKGFANFAGPTGVPLTRAPQLSSLLLQMCTAIDIALTKPPVPVPPMALAMYSASSSTIVSKKVKG